MSANMNPFVEFAQGEIIFKEGDPGSEMFIIESGEVQINRAMALSQPVALLSSGDFFGEMAVLEDQPRFATAMAATKVRLLKIDRASFAEVLRENVEISIRIMRKLANRLRRAEERLSVTNPLFAQAPAMESKAQIAARESSSPESISFNTKKDTPSSPRGKSVGIENRSNSQLNLSVTENETRPAKTAANKIGERQSGPMATLKNPRLKHKNSDAVFDLNGHSEFLVGRPDPVTGISPEVNLGPLDGAQRSISRRHAKIIRLGEGLAVREDVGTVNGTFVNGVRLKAGEAVPIHAGDQLRFGLVDLVLISD